MGCNGNFGSCGGCAKELVITPGAPITEVAKRISAIVSEKTGSDPLSARGTEDGRF